MDSAFSAAEDERVQLLRNVENLNYGSRQVEETGQGDEENPEPVDPGVRETDREHVIERLTGRLRCLFSAITWPIVPLGTLVTLCLVWVMYSAFVMDLKASCSHPLHVYAVASLCFLFYAPYHSKIRSLLFRYTRERDGPIRPTRVRLYDQLFHTLCILYVYGGVTLIQSCKQSVDQKNSGFSDPSSSVHNSTEMAEFLNTCDATCPHLYSALDLYVTMLELFTLSLILPLLFLPCIYLWILRRASSDPDNFWHESLDDNDDLFGHRHPRVTAQELIDSLEPVIMVKRGDHLVLCSRSEALPTSNIAKECCICMSEFKVQNQDGDVFPLPSVPAQEADAIVRTKCGHIFHATCLGGWVGGRWDPHDRRRRTRRTCCPLCREDLQPTPGRRTSSTSTRPNVEQ